MSKSFRVGRLLFFFATEEYLMIGARLYGLYIGRSAIGIVVDDSWYQGDISIALVLGKRFTCGVFFEPRKCG